MSECSTLFQHLFLATYPLLCTEHPIPPVMPSLSTPASQQACSIHALIQYAALRCAALPAL